MSKIVLKAENISKQYRLGQLGTGTISHDLNRLWARVRGKEDPYLQVGEANDRSVAGGSDYVWSLRDINFEVKQGEVLGIIGKNGAGKSTLLKILSQVTTPTTGQVKVKGRIAALLEVGTGFHPDLSGRENVFLNGAILGMTKAEIKSKLEEIVDFSGVAKYLDTPVKRYSSGMMVRLGFAVAAHLEPEILIVDEVLAVGDQEFQDKCLGKMQDVSRSGRTVLFVSHNLPSIQNLCTSCIYLQKGQIKENAATSRVIESYLSENRNIQLTGEIPTDFFRPYSNGEAYFRKLLIKDLENNVIDKLAFNQPFKVVMELDVMKKLSNVMLNVNLGTTLGQPILYAVDKTSLGYNSKEFNPGKHFIETVFNLKLLPGNYSFTIGLNYLANGKTIDWIENIGLVSVDKVGYNNLENYPFENVHGYIEPETKWTYK